MMNRPPSTSDARDVVLMVDALPGFESCRRFVLMSSTEIEPFRCLQGLDEPRPAFLVIDPAAVVDDFPRALSEGDRRRLGAETGEPLLWLSVIRFDRRRRAAANLLAPIVINPRRMVGLQVVAPDATYGSDHPIEVM